MPPSGEVRMVLRTTFKPRTENDMTTDKKVARRKLSLLELASDLGNVSKACRMIGYSRQQFYEIRATFRPMAPMGCSTACPAPSQPGRGGDRDGDPRPRPDPPLPRPDAGCPGADAARHPGLLRRHAWGLAAPQSIDQARSAAAAGEGHGRPQTHPLRGADQAFGAVQPGIPRAPYRGA